MRVNMCSIFEKSIFMSSNLPAMNERGWMFLCMSMCVVPVIYLCWGLAFYRP